MVQKTLFCPRCSEILDPSKPTCPRCGEQVQYDPDEIMMDLALKARKRSLIPWGLIFFFAVYICGVYVFINYYYKQTPEYQAALHYDVGDRILGDDDGKTAETEQLFIALDEYIKGTQITPGQDYGYQRIETIQHRFYERKIKLNDQQQRDLDRLNRMRASIIQSRKPMLLVGARDIWDIDALEELPRKIVNYSLVGAIVLLFFGILRSWMLRRKYDQMADKRIEERRVENMSDKEYAAYQKKKKKELLMR